MYPLLSFFFNSMDTFCLAIILQNLFYRLFCHKMFVFHPKLIRKSDKVTDLSKVWNLD